jgi:hypothetical protein
MDSEDDTRDSADEDFYSDGEAGLALSDDGDADYDFADRDSDDSDGPISHRQQVIIDRSIGAVPPDRSRPRDCLLGTVEMGDPVAMCRWSCLFPNDQMPVCLLECSRVQECDRLSDIETVLVGCGCLDVHRELAGVHLFRGG